MNITYIVMMWAGVGIVTAGLAVYRRFVVTATEEDVIRLAPGEEVEVENQEELAQKLTTIDRWGKALTALTLIIGLGIAATYGYKAWQDPTSVPNNFYMRTAPGR